MATYPKCPNCGNDNDGENIWSCRSCGFVHCEDCDEDNGHCPNCQEHGMRCVGHIDSSTTDQRTSHGTSFSSCPRCGKTSEGDTIWECTDCGCEHCEDCDPDDGRCPKCGGSTKQIGTIGY